MEKRKRTPSPSGLSRPAKLPPSPIKDLKHQLKESGLRYAELLGHLPVGVYRSTPEGHLVGANTALVRMLGYASEKELLKVNVQQLYARSGDRDAYLQTLHRRIVYTTELKLRRKDGRAIWGRDYCRAIKDPKGTIICYDGILVDITREKQAEEKVQRVMAKLAASNKERQEMIRKLQDMSVTDDLTGLYNRRGFYLVSKQVLALSDRKKSLLYLIFVDLDDLKRINDTYGHHIGDEALIATAEIIRTTFRASDVKGRMGGDEFAVFPIDAAIEGAGSALARFQEALDDFNRSNRFPFRLSVSTGVACNDPENPSTIEELLVRADKLMYEQKRSKNER